MNGMARPGGGGASCGGIYASRGHLVTAIVMRDLKQIHRHGIMQILALSVLLLVAGFILFQLVSSQFRHTGVPSWTGMVITEEGGEGLAAEISADRLSGPAPLSVAFTSNVTGGTPPYTYSWNPGGGLSSNLKNPSLTYDNSGGYECWLTVRDSTGENVTAAPLRLIVSGDPAGGLRAAVSVNRSEATAPFAVAFRAAVAGGTPPYTYAWALGDGSNSTESAPAHTYGEPGSFTISLVVRDSAGNATAFQNITVTAGRKEGGGGLPFNLLDVVYGWCVLVSMFVVPTAFSAGYGHEMRKGTVRTLVCYPAGVVEITAAKLVYAAIVGFIFSALAGLLPSLASMKPAGEVAGVFFTAYILTLTTVAVGAFGAVALTRLTKRMYIRPTGLPTMLVALSFLFTAGIFRSLLSGLKLFLGLAGLDPDGAVRSWMPAITLSPYHLGGASLSAALGGGGSPPLFVVAVPVLLLAAGVWISKKVYPDIYEKE